MHQQSRSILRPWLAPHCDVSSLPEADVQRTRTCLLGVASRPRTAASSGWCAPAARAARDRKRTTKVRGCPARFLQLRGDPVSVQPLVRLRFEILPRIQRQISRKAYRRFEDYLLRQLVLYSYSLALFPLQCAFFAPIRRFLHENRTKRMARKSTSRCKSRHFL